jgi:hypothetical protein
MVRPWPARVRIFWSILDHGRVNWTDFSRTDQARRSCKIPPANNIEVQFHGDKAKLKWPVSIDGKKLESETYKILAVLDKP